MLKGERQDRYMPLDTEPYSTASHLLIDELAKAVHRQAGKQYKITRELRCAVGAVIGDLFANATEDSDRYGFRSVCLSTF